MHCWPRVQESINECYRVLKPGGKLFASTFLSGLDLSTSSSSSSSSSSSFMSKNPIAKALKPIQMNYFKNQNLQTGFQVFESVEKLENIFINAGFGCGDDGDDFVAIPPSNNDDTNTSTNESSTTSTTADGMSSMNVVSISDTDTPVSDVIISSSSASSSSNSGEKTSSRGLSAGRENKLMLRREGRQCVIIKAIK